MAKYLFIFLGWCLLVPAHALQNQLVNHPSPYLAMHGNDPVQWQDWGEAALAKARAEDKLIFISSGYFSCHWCHVMQRESYANPEIAKLLNEFFIPVKIDRELHGALDAYLIDYVEKTQGNAGWPLNAFMTPEGYPLIGATYLPPERFSALLSRLDGYWQTDRNKTRNLARRALLQLMRKPVAEGFEPLSEDAVRAALIKSTLSVADLLEGGFGQQSRFPMTPQLLALLDIQQQQPTPQIAEFLMLTLDQIASEGLRDQLGGGFYRYTVDPSWLTPHYEKMLYTQAQLAEVFLTGARVLRRPDYVDVARDTLDFVVRDMQGLQGGMVASFSAVDDKGEEGAYYLWTAEQLTEVLCSRDQEIAARYWRMQGAAIDPGALPRKGENAGEIALAMGLEVDLVSKRLSVIKDKMLTARKHRVLPVDDKELAGWNGLLLAAFARAAVELGDAEYAVTAQQLHRFLTKELWDGKRLLRAKSGELAIGKASLADYAYVAYGLSRYAQLSGSSKDRALVQQLLAQAWQRFHGPGGWKLTDQALIPGMGATFAMVEGALPSPSAMLLELSLNFGDEVLRKKAKDAVELSRGDVQKEPFWYAGHALLLLPQHFSGQTQH